LESKKLVTVTSTDDRRVRHVAITERGRTALAAALPAWRKAQAAVTKRIDHVALHALSESFGARA
jgi:DNA-binding MarR family transcriptional regulator